MTTVAERARAVRLLLLDVDGVLTDGRLYFGPDGIELKAFHSRDGLGLRIACDAGLLVGLISGRASVAVDARARELGLHEIWLGVGDKLAVLAEILGRRGLDSSQVAYVGDDLVDLAVMQRVGLAIAVPEAPDYVRARAHYTTVRAGGSGAVREAIELILSAQGLWQAAIDRYSGG